MIRKNIPISDFSRLQIFGAAFWPESQYPQGGRPRTSNAVGIFMVLRQCGSGSLSDRACAGQIPRGMAAVWARSSAQKEPRAVEIAVLKI